MDIAFRVDASIEIGSGHVMRCLTLADAFKAHGVRSHFVCREHDGNMIDVIAQKGYLVYRLPVEEVINKFCHEGEPEHFEWLGADWETDAEKTEKHFEDIKLEWLIVDHYALEKKWESKLRRESRKIMVIDDLADRYHECDVLLDQTYGQEKNRYSCLVPSCCHLMLGAKFALLRPEFHRLRESSLAKRDKPIASHLLITMGGVDKDDATSDVLSAIEGSELPSDCIISVVMGASAPWLEKVREKALMLPWNVSVKVDVSNMAELMASSFLVIGAAGSTSWERCSLGVPTIMAILAKNQRVIASGLALAGAASVFEADDADFVSLVRERLNECLADPVQLVSMSASARDVCKGDGVERVINRLGLN